MGVLKAKQRRGLGMAATFAALCLVAVLGESRPAASVVVGDASQADASLRPVSGDSREFDFGADVDGPSGSTADARDDDARLAPAVFAPDPEVRFVYNRHISKWM